MIPSAIPAALRRKCPVCDAEVGQRCRAMNQTAYPKPRKTIHPERRQSEGMSTAAAAKAMRAARPEQLGRDEFRAAGHGTAARYQRGCRCADCRRARAAYVAEWRTQRLGTLAPDDPLHGTLNAYCNLGCRCGPCKRASAAYARQLHQRNREAAQIAT